MNPRIHDRVLGSLVGGAVGDALGAPMECLHFTDIRRIYGDAGRFEDISPAMLAERLKLLKAWSVELGKVTDDTVLADLLLDCILENGGKVTAHAFAKAWEKFEEPVLGPDGESVLRLDLVHWIERIPYLRNRLREIPKRELGHGEANATNAVMFIAPVGLLCAGDPLKAELMAVDVTAVNQHGKPRDVAGGYAAALAACFLPGVTVEEIVRIGLEQTRDWRHVKEITAMLELARNCKSCAEFIERYHQEIIGPLLPLADLQHEDSGLSVSWNSAEILGPALAFFLITRGQDAREMMLASARIGRDADTICRCSGGLAGAYGGLKAIPQDWRDYVLPRNRWLRLEEKAAKLSALIEASLEKGIQTQRGILEAG